MGRVEILHAVQYDTQQPTDFIFTRVNEFQPVNEFPINEFQRAISQKDNSHSH